jgi:hypothetical protein
MFRPLSPFIDCCFLKFLGLSNYFFEWCQKSPKGKHGGYMGKSTSNSPLTGEYIQIDKKVQVS